MVARARWLVVVQCAAIARFTQPKLFCYLGTPCRSSRKNTLHFTRSNQGYTGGHPPSPTGANEPTNGATRSSRDMPPLAGAAAEPIARPVTVACVQHRVVERDDAQSRVASAAHTHGARELPGGRHRHRPAPQRAAPSAAAVARAADALQNGHKQCRGRRPARACRRTRRHSDHPLVVALSGCGSLFQQAAPAQQRSTVGEPMTRQWRACA